MSGCVLVASCARDARRAVCGHAIQLTPANYARTAHTTHPNSRARVQCRPPSRPACKSCSTPPAWLWTCRRSPRRATCLPERRCCKTRLCARWAGAACKVVHVWCECCERSCALHAAPAATLHAGNRAWLVKHATRRRLLPHLAQAPHAACCCLPAACLLLRAAAAAEHERPHLWRLPDEVSCIHELHSDCMHRWGAGAQQARLARACPVTSHSFTAGVASAHPHPTDRRAFELAFSTTYLFAGSRPAFVRVDDITFRCVRACNWLQSGGCMYACMRVHAHACASACVLLVVRRALRLELFKPAVGHRQPCLHARPKAPRLAASCVVLWLIPCLPALLPAACCTHAVVMQ